MTSFDALTQAAEGIVADIRSRVGQNTENRMISYLPLAHSFEPVSYTHLDVYKRQALLDEVLRQGLAAGQGHGGLAGER